MQYYKLTDDLSSGYTTIYGGDRFPFHANFVPGQANSIGLEDFVAIEDYSFLEVMATGKPFSPSFKEAVDVVSVQQALIDSWSSRVGVFDNAVAAPTRALTWPRLSYCFPGSEVWISIPILNFCPPQFFCGLILAPVGP
jgi:hypothetical protein